MPTRETIDIIYDGSCAFCVRSMRIVRALDVWRLLRFVDGTDRPQVEARYRGLRGVDLDQAMFAVTEDGGVYRGYFAFRRLLWVSPLMWPLIPLFYFPGARLVGPRLYAWIARNRRSLGCRSSACSIPPSPGHGLSGRGIDKGRIV